MKLTPGAKRLDRLLALIPFIIKNQGIDLEKTASLFGVDEEQLISDLNLIWLCGLPGYSHLELIDVSYDSGIITIDNADTLNRPMRLTFDECVSLLIGVDNLLSITPVSDKATLTSIRKKLLQIMGINVIADESQGHSTNSQLVLPEILKAVEQPTRICSLKYFSATSYEEEFHEVLPIHISNQSNFVYLFAYSFNGDKHRYFRLDRIREFRVLDKQIPETASLSTKSRLKSPDETLTAEVEIRADGYWFIQKWGLSSLTFNQSRDVFTGQIKVFDPRWLIRAAMSTGGLLEIKGPESLRRELASVATQALKMYGSD